MKIEDKDFFGMGGVFAGNEITTMQERKLALTFDCEKNVFNS
jgi:hypothetical protein